MQSGLTNLQEHNMNEESFKLKIYQYQAGLLNIINKEFKLIDEAIKHGLAEECHKFKIYDKDGNVCHGSEGHHNTYA